MNRPRSRGQWIVGLLSLWPSLYVLGFTTSLVDTIRFVSGRPPAFGPARWAYWAPMLTLHVVSSLVLLLVVVACLAHLSSNDTIDESLRLPLFLLLVMFGPVVAPVYWWREMVLSSEERVRRLRP